MSRSFKPAVLLLVASALGAGCAPELVGAACVTDDNCPTDQLCQAKVCVAGQRGSSDAGASDSGTGPSADAGVTDAGVTDAGVSDAGMTDAGTTDAGVTDAGVTDAGVTDAGMTDAGMTDAGVTDAGMTDAGMTDAGVTDAGMTDAGMTDAGMTDAGPPDAGPPDAGPPDAGPPDAGPPDAGPPDAGPPDAGPPDAGPPDAGPPDAGPPDAGPPDAGTYSIGGTITGVAGPGLSLTLSGIDTIADAGNGAFAFMTRVAHGGMYTVGVLTRPTAPSQVCTVSNATGTAVANVTNVGVNCTTEAFNVSGTITGLTGSGLELTLNGGQRQAVSGTSFQFPIPVASGQPYVVAVAGQPFGPAQTCTAQQASGTIGSANVSNVSITCTLGAPLRNLPVGAIVYDTYTLGLDGGPLEWRLVDSLPGGVDGGVTLMTRRRIASRGVMDEQWMNRWSTSNLRLWLNTRDGGFVSRLSPDFDAVVLPTDWPWALDNPANTMSSTGVAVGDKVAIISRTEVGGPAASQGFEGTRFAWFDGGAASRIGDEAYYWTRTGTRAQYNSVWYDLAVYTVWANGDFLTAWSPDTLGVLPVVKVNPNALFLEQSDQRFRFSPDGG